MPPQPQNPAQWISTRDNVVMINAAGIKSYNTVHTKKTPFPVIGM